MKNKSILIATVALGLLCGSAVSSQAQLSAYQSAVMATPGLVSYYQFDVGSGWDYNGPRHLVESFSGYTPAAYTTGMGGGLALTQNGSGNGVPYSYPWAYPGTVNPADFASGAGTVELWVKPGWVGNNAGTSPTIDLPIIFSDLYLDVRYSVGMLPDRSQIVMLDGFNGAQFFTLPTAAGNDWHQLAVTFDAGNATVLWDGLSLGTQASPLGSLANAPEVFSLGAYRFSNTTYTYLPWTGQLDEVAIYDTALSDTSILGHYNAMVPEPTTMSLILAAAGLCFLRKRRQGV